MRQKQFKRVMENLFWKERRDRGNWGNFISYLDIMEEIIKERNIMMKLNCILLTWMLYI
jgi:hypothetical protein